MPTFYIIAGVKIVLYFADHNPPHFHAIFAEYDALIAIETCEILEGDLPNTKRKKILDWAKEHKSELLEIWNDLN